MLLDKKNALYVKCCIIPNGVTDSQGDTLYSEDIKKIFTSFNNQDNFEVYHDDLPIPEVSLLENYISTADERIGNLVVPPGSWNATVRVDNPEIKRGLLTGEFGGVSLNNRIAPRCKGKLKGTVRYKDVPDAECVIPLLISFVESGANGYPLHVMDYDAYIKKSKDTQLFKEDNGGHLMDFKEFLNGLKSLIKEAEEPPVEDAAIEKEDEAIEEEESVVETSTDEDTVEEETTEDDEPVVEKEDTATEEAEENVDDDTEGVSTTDEEEEPAQIEKAEPTEEDTSLEERVAALEKIIAELTATPAEEAEEEEEETIDEEEEVIDEDTPKITKSEKVIITPQNTPETTNYYEMTGRDPHTGKKIRK